MRGKKHKMLLVESDKVYRRSLSRMFFAQGFRISVASNTLEAMEFLSQLAFSLVVFDLRRPDESEMNGLQRIIDCAGAARVLVLTAYGESVIVDRVLRMGAKQCLIKPIKRQEILDAARNAL